MNIEGRTVLITGANRGIGAALTVGAINQGAARIFALVRNRDNMSWCDDKRVTALQADVRNFDEVLAASKEVPRLDVIINNAGILRNQPIVGGSDAALNARDEIEVNYLGTLNVVNAFWKTLTSDALAGEHEDQHRNR